MAAIQTVEKIIAFVCKRDELKIDKMDIEMDGGDKCRRVYIDGALGRCGSSITFHTGFILDKDDNSNWSILPFREEIHFNVSCSHMALNTEVVIFLQGNDKFEVCTGYENLVKHLHSKIKKILS